MMAQYSFGGHAAGQISEGHYSFIHDKNVNLEEIQQKILDIAAAQGISPAKLNSASVTGDLKAMDKTEIARALEHTIKKYAEQGSTMKIDTLNKGYTDYLSANAAKLKELKATIDRVSFGQHFANKLFNFAPSVLAKTRLHVFGGDEIEESHDYFLTP